MITDKEKSRRLMEIYDSLVATRALCVSLIRDGEKVGRAILNDIHQAESIALRARPESAEAERFTGYGFTDAEIYALAINQDLRGPFLGGIVVRDL